MKLPSSMMALLPEVEYLEVRQSEPLRNEYEHFLNVASGNVIPLTDGYEGQRVVKVLSAASLSERKK
jgi:UDP-2-acetamido-3-amino-2,3-dideoxy-glucuronate N-acetyltransferase